LKEYVHSRLETLFSILLIIITTALTYGALIAQLGYYRDDWYMLWVGQAQGPAGIIQLFQTDRPFIGWLYALDYRMLGDSPLGWHIYALILKILGVLAFFWLARLIWPEKRVETTFAALLFALYPGFLQQPNAATFKNLILCYDTAILSIALTIYVTRTSNRALQIAATILALVTQLFSLLIYESLIGMEAARLILLWYALRRREPLPLKNEFIRLLKYMLPYLFVAGGFLFWRLFIFKSVRHSTNVDILFGQYTSAPVHSLLSLGIELLKDFFETLVLAWSVPFYQFTASDPYDNFLYALGLGILIAGFAGLYLWWIRRQSGISENAPGDRTDLSFIYLGLPIVLLTSLPIVAAGRNVIFAIQWDRYTYQAILGVALAVCGFAFYAFRGRLRWGFLLSLLVISVMTQYHTAVYYRDLWTYQKTAWWQLAWRAPDLQPGTTLILSLPEGYQLAEEYEVWGPANMIYNRHGPIYVTGQVMTDTLPVDLSRADVENREMRSVMINRDYSKPLIVSFSSPRSCVHVMDGSQPFASLTESQQVGSVARFSNINLINVSAEQKLPPVEIFGPEPPKNWCYYYQKIQLSLQKGDWQNAANLADEAEANSLNPADLTEWMPVVEAYANSNQPQKAIQITRRIKSDLTTRDLLCMQLAQVTKWPTGYQPDKIIAPLCNSGK